MTDEQAICRVDLTNWREARLLGPRLLIEQYAPEEASAGGIHLPDSARHHYMAAHVRKIGEGVDDSIGVSVGDTIIYGAAGPVRLAEIGERMLYLHVDEVVLVYPNPQRKEPSNDGQEQNAV